MAEAQSAREHRVHSKRREKKCKFHQPHPWVVQVSITSWSQERRVIFPSGNTEATVRNKGVPCYRLPVAHYLESGK